jgi:hypothetical protein
MQIEMASPMLLALRNGDDTYQPVIGGLTLEVECGEPEISARNLAKVMDCVGKDRLVLGFFLQHGHVLVIFASGEAYLATGFGYGHEQAQVSHFAAFAHEQGFGAYTHLFNMLSGLDADYNGAMPSIARDFPRQAGESDPELVTNTNSEI